METHENNTKTNVRHDSFVHTPEIYASDLQLIEKASNLLYFLLSPKNRSLKNLEYRELTKEYTKNSIFQEIFKAIASGLCLTILDTKSSNIIITPQSNSLFAAKTADLPLTKNLEQRKHLGLILISIASYFYPNSIKFQDSRTGIGLTAELLDKYIRDIAQEIKSKEPSEGQDVSLDEDSMNLLTEYLALKKDMGSTKAQSGTLRMIERALKYLMDEKLLVFDKPQYFPTEKFRKQVEQLSQDPILLEFLKIEKEGLEKEGRI